MVPIFIGVRNTWALKYLGTEFDLDRSQAHPTKVLKNKNQRVVENIIQTIVLAIVQGIAEFLPISSSGHLVILGAIFHQITGAVQSESPTMEIILHAGTLGSILVIYWQRILNLLTSDRRVIPLLIVGTIPAVIIGLTIKSQFPGVLKNPLLAGAMLLVTGAMLIVLGKLPKREGHYQEMTFLNAFIIGCFQAFAILPGISRSGSTILGGRFLGLKTDDAVTFSFLLAIPAISGATVLAIKDVLEEATPSHGAIELVAGAAISFVVGIFALKWLINWSRLDRLHWFAAWCIPAGIVVLLFGTLGLV
ncbi:undecaprenyl-diphosphate phosphatase [Roseiconus lacunae]|uniref:undecaprenyl-diphosphate phosphatase n=1 Tax=Roseiconus lacunae TaxID=2605694 RepID=UPI001E301CA0|nr:undecaprenyl-diphosphate phosphatase [Roseiconus lacunae]